MGVLMQRIGIAIGRACGATRRRAQYGLYDFDRCRLEGYRELQNGEEVLVRFSEQALLRQRFIPFVRAHFRDVRWFGDWAVLRK